MFGVALEELHEVIGRIQDEVAGVPSARLSYELFKLRSAIDRLESLSDRMLASNAARTPVLLPHPADRHPDSPPWIA